MKNKDTLSKLREDFKKQLPLLEKNCKKDSSSSVLIYKNYNITRNLSALNFKNK